MTIRIAALLFATFGLSTCASGVPDSAGDVRWWRGNLHTHSLWTDGEEFPEMIAAWYRDHGYDFVVITEHDMLQEGGDRWVDVNAPDEGWPPRNASARAALPGYVARFGDDWVEQRRDGRRHLVRLRPLSEYRHLFEVPGEFLLVMGEEITDRQGAHVNVVNADTALLPRGGDSTATRTRRNLAAAAAQRRTSGHPSVAIINHPNYVWSLTAEEIAAMPDARLFEVYNGHGLVNNDGDALHASTERMWDVILALRMSAGAPAVFGVATDDAHEYHADTAAISPPGRGWVMVRAPSEASALTPEHIVAALDAGDFYASTGVTLRDVRCADGRLDIEIDAASGASYRTYFIGTRRGQSLASTPVLGVDSVTRRPTGDTLRTTRHYDEGVGAVLAQVDGTSAHYDFAGDELYVRARIESSEPQIDPLTGNVLGVQRAWIQPCDAGS